MKNEKMYKILLVDDAPTSLTDLIDAMKGPDNQIFVATNGERAIEIAESNNPDLILLDIIMPEMDGFGVCKKLKSKPKTKDIPIIFLTAKTETEDLLKGFDIGAVDYVKKPFNRVELLARVKTHLELKRSREELKKLNKTQEELLVHQSKMAAMGEMISAIAHQWRQPLSSINVILCDIMDAYEYGEMNPDYLKSSIDSSIKQVDFMNKTIDIFKNFFSPSGMVLTFKIYDTIEETLILLQSQLRSSYIRVNLTTTRERERYTARGLPNEFKQVILNIVKNGSDAILNSYENKTLKKEEEGMIDIDITEDGALTAIKIRDNGGGVPEDILESIFDPYFTTRKGRGGTGIGLYISKKIIEDHMKGSLSVRNVKGGSEFTITLPSSD